jgi:hypothetical protein
LRRKPDATTHSEPLVERLYTLEELTELRRNTLRCARAFPPGNERKQHLQVAVSLRQRELLAVVTGPGQKTEIGSKSYRVICSGVHAEEARNKDYDDHDANDVKNVHCTLRLKDRRKKAARSLRPGFFSAVFLPAIVTDTDAHARGAEAKAGARLVVIITAPLDVLLAGSIVVGIAVALLDNNAS